MTTALPSDAYVVVAPACLPPPLTKVYLPPWLRRFIAIGNPPVSLYLSLSYGSPPSSSSNTRKNNIPLLPTPPNPHPLAWSPLLLIPTMMMRQIRKSSSHPSIIPVMVSPKILAPPPYPSPAILVTSRNAKVNVPYGGGGDKAAVLPPLPHPKNTHMSDDILL